MDASLQQTADGYDHRMRVSALIVVAKCVDQRIPFN